MTENTEIEAKEVATQKATKTTVSKDNVYEALTYVQEKLIAPKSQYNNFGKFSYRSCEDILAAAKPLMKEAGAVLIISDDLRELAGRVYIEATATFRLANGKGEVITNKALAREAEQKSGMDASQLTGTASSYARKYALNGLFNIDDVKDPDTDAYHNQTSKGNIEKSPVSAEKAENYSMTMETKLKVGALTGKKLSEAVEAENIKTFDSFLDWAHNNASKTYSGPEQQWQFNHFVSHYDYYKKVIADKTAKIA